MSSTGSPSVVSASPFQGSLAPYGPVPAGDGDPAAYLYTWDEASQTFERAD